MKLQTKEEAGTESSLEQPWEAQICCHLFQLCCVYFGFFVPRMAFWLLYGECSRGEGRMRLEITGPADIENMGVSLPGSSCSSHMG